MPGLFGLSPDEIIAQQRQATDQRAQAYGQASPIQRINEGYYKAGAGLADAGAGLFGLKNPQVEQAKQLQALTSNGDLSPDGLIMMAKKLNDAGFTDKALLLLGKAKELKLQEAKEAKEQALTKKYSSSGVSESDIEEFNEWQSRRPEEGASPAEIAAWWRSAPRAILQKAANNIAAKDIGAPKDVYGEAKGREKGKLDARIEAGIPLVKSPSTSKESKAEKKKEDAAISLDASLSAIEKDYAELEKLGGIVDPSKSTYSNIKARIASSGVGQTLGGAIGTKEQSLRNAIRGTIPLLILDIKNATGASAQQMNSNVELQNFMRAASDPSSDIKANLKLLKNLRDKYVKPNANIAAKEFNLRSPAEVKAEYKSGGLTKEEAKAILKDMEKEGIF